MTIANKRRAPRGDPQEEPDMKNTLKKIVCLTLALVMVLSLAACGKGAPSDSASGGSGASGGKAEATPAPEFVYASEFKTLVKNSKDCINARSYNKDGLFYTKDEKVGDDVAWKLESDGKLTLSGTGATWGWLTDFPGFYYFSGEVTSAVVGEGVTELGLFLFWNMNKLNKVSLPSTLTRVGSGAFVKCTSLSVYAFFAYSS